ncbi:MAG: helix-turn-helix domain-containing protein [Solirubrobacteraceae bacterium]
MPASPDPQVALGRAIRIRREELGLKQDLVASHAEIQASWLSHIEAGEQNPAWATVDRIARALGWSLADLAVRAETLETEDRKPTNEPLKPKG